MSRSGQLSWARANAHIRQAACIVTEQDIARFFVPITAGAVCAAALRRGSGKRPPAAVFDPGLQVLRHNRRRESYEARLL